MTSPVMTKDGALQNLNEVLNPELWKPSKFGFTVPFFLTPESLEELARLPLEPSDVFIVTYPKSGTTWTQNIVKLIRNKGEKDGVQLSISVPWAEANTFTDSRVDLAAMPKPRAFKSHLGYNHQPCGAPSTTPCKYIYVVRNPKDVAVSMYFHYCWYFVRRDAKLEWDLFFRNFVCGNVLFGDFFNHVLSWWPHRNDENVLFLVFEEMKKDLQSAVIRIAKFIEADISDEVVDKVVAATTFDAMKSDDTANKSALNKYANPDSTPFMRKGEVGDWRNHFTLEQSAEMDKICKERLEGSGLVFDFGDH